MGFGATMEARSKGLDALVASHRLTRINAYSIADSLYQLALGRIDFTDTSVSSFRALTKTPMYEGRYVTVPVPEDPQWWVIAKHYALLTPSKKQGP